MAAENRLIFYSSPPSLKSITASSIAVNLWRNKIISGAFEYMFHDTWKQFSFHNTLPIPQVLVSLIDHHIIIVLREIKLWVNFNAFRIQLRERLAFNILKIHFDKIVWHPDSTIDEVQTAKNMLTWPQLSIFHKLRIASTYCFVEDVHELRPSLPPTVELVCFTYDEDPLLYYWEQRYKDQLEGIVTPNLRLGAMRMMNNPKVDRWTAIEYLFDQAKEIERLNLCSFIVSQERSSIVKNLMAKLNETQLNYVITRHGYRVMVCFLTCPDSRQIARQTWNYFKDRIDKYQFCRLIHWMLKTEVSHSRRLNETLVSACIEIWAQASDRLQRYVFHQICNDPEFLYEYTLDNLKLLPRNMTFLIRILSDASYDVRNYIWMNNWRKIIRGARPIHLHDLLKICLEEDLIDDFKETIMLEFHFIREYCRDLVRLKCYKEMDAYLTFCSSDKKKILFVKNCIIVEYFSGEIEYSLGDLIEIFEGVFRVTNLQMNDLDRLIFSDDGDLIIGNRVSNSRRHFGFIFRLLRSFFQKYFCCSI